MTGQACATAIVDTVSHLLNRAEPLKARLLNQVCQPSAWRYCQTVTWLLGIDGGGTRTRALIVNPDGVILGRGEAGSSNYHAVGLPAAAESLAGALQEALAGARVKERPSGAFFGLAWVRTAADHQAVREILTGLPWPEPPAALALDHDLRSALAGGCANGPGVVVVAGTGSAAYGRDRLEHTAQAGGWGWVLDDLGSGYWIAVQGLRSVVEAADGRGQPTRLEPALLAELSVTSARDAMLWAQSASTTRAQLASLASVVLATAEDDPVAAAILAEGARQLGRLVTAVMSRLDFSTEQSVRVVPAGGALSHPRYQAAFAAELARVSQRCSLVVHPGAPILGAVFLAGEVAGRPLSEAARQRLADGWSASKI